MKKPISVKLGDNQPHILNVDSEIRDSLDLIAWGKELSRARVIETALAEYVKRNLGYMEKVKALKEGLNK